ncbi:MAG: TIGR03936 family radical SAM-associated protein [Oscillospiraceae bacterium]|jgi:radical SAM-linked protein|nr:TIGR03936 family radical SAM-associated protein [Oscillospiraceae bacterium]
MRAIVEFQKLDRFIGHLDVLRSFQRTILRSRLPVAYSQGFHPHMLVSLASPTSVGQAGLAEYVDISLAEFAEEEAFLKRLAEASPTVLPPVRCRTVLDSHPKLMAMLRTASYEIAIDEHADEIARVAETLWASEAYSAVRVSKTKTREINIRAMIHELSAENGKLRARVSFTEAETVKPDLLVETLCKIAGVDVPHTKITRTGLFGEYGGVAVPLIDM